MKIQKLIFLLCFFVALNMVMPNASGKTIVVSPEAALLQTDRVLYVAGENIFFRIYLVDARTLKPSIISSIAYLVLRNNANIPVVKIKLKVKNGITYGSVILPDSMKTGPCQITVFTNYMRNFGEEFYATKQIFVANRFDNKLTTLSNSSYLNANPANGAEPNEARNISVSTDKTTYSRREKISISLDLPKATRGDTARLSVSVSEAAPASLSYSSNYQNLRRGFQNPMQSQQSDTKKAGFLPEVNGEIIQGQVIKQGSKKPVANTLVYLSALDTIVSLQYTVTDSCGMFRFLMTDYYYDKDLYFSIKDDAKETNFQIIIDDKFGLQNAFKSSTEEGNPALKEFILKSQEMVTIQKAYEAESTPKSGKQFVPASGCPQLYYKPNYCIYPADFLPLNDFAEIAREILPPQFSLKKRNDIYSVNLADETRHEYFEQEPKVFLDGVYIDNINQLMKLGSDKVKRIELVCSSFNIGDLIFPGILAVFSKTNEIRNIKPNASTIHMKLQAFDANSGSSASLKTNEFPTYQPDFRQLLYWNPNIEFSENHFQLPEFNASDHEGNYIITIEGITSGGTPVSATSRINVK